MLATGSVTSRNARHSGSVPRVDGNVSGFQLSARARSNRQKLLVTLAASCLCAALVALLGDDSGYKKYLLSVQQLDDSTASTAAKDMYGQGAGAGFNGVSHFEPVEDADTGIAQSNLGGDYIGGSQDEDYSYDQTKRMYIHKGEVNTLDTEQVKRNKELADKKLLSHYRTLSFRRGMQDMPGILSFPGKKIDIKFP